MDIDMEFPSTFINVPSHTIGMLPSELVNYIKPDQILDDAIKLLILQTVVI